MLGRRASQSDVFVIFLQREAPTKRDTRCTLPPLHVWSVHGSPPKPAICDPNSCRPVFLYISSSASSSPLHHCPRSGSPPSLKLYPILLTASGSLASLCDVTEYFPICVFLQFALELKPSVSAGSRSISGVAQPSTDQVWLWP